MSTPGKRGTDKENCMSSERETQQIDGRGQRRKHDFLGEKKWQKKSSLTRDIDPGGSRHRESGTNGTMPLG